MAEMLNVFLIVYYSPIPNFNYLYADTMETNFQLCHDRLSDKWVKLSQRTTNHINTCIK